MTGNFDATVNIQYPPSGSFRSESLVWNAEEAWFPLDRLPDLLRGECSRPEVPTSFKVRRTEDPTMETCKCTIRYWCAYGPTDLRKQTQTTIDVTSTRTGGKKPRPLARKTKLGTSQQRGCQSHFAVYMFRDKPTVCCVRWKLRRHVDAAGVICHGLQDPTAIAVNAHLAPRISNDLRLFMERLLRAHVQPTDIVKEHHRMVRGRMVAENHSEQQFWSRDMQLTIKDVLNVQAALRRQSQVYSSCDATSVRMWVQSNSEKIIFYQERKPEENQPFICVWATPWMISKLSVLGHESVVSMDATFGTNCYEYLLFTLLCFDEFQNGVPCVWALMERGKTEDLVQVLSAVKTKVESHRVSSGIQPPEWRPTCWLVDDAPEEYASLNNVFPDIPVNLCLFHVRRAWIKQLHAKVKDPFKKAEINKELGQIMYTTNEGQFRSYYRTHWHPRIDRWAKVYRQYQHNNQESQGGIERWHSTLKAHLRCSRRGKSGRKIFWLVRMLTETVETFFWCASELKRQGRLRNNIVGRLVLASIIKAKDMPDSNVLDQSTVDGKEVAWVRSGSDPSRIHEVVGWNSDKGGCSCGWAVQGNVCKHQIKVLLLAGYTELELLKKLGIKYGTVAGGFENLIHTSATTDEDVLNMEIHMPDDNPVDDVPPSQVGLEDHLNTVNIEEFMTEASKMWSAVQHSPNLASHAMALLKDAHRRTLDVIAVAECANESAAIEEDPAAEFVAVPGTDGSLLRRRSWVKKIMERPRRRRRQGDENCPPASNVRPAEGIQFQKVQSSRPRPMQEVLEAEALASLDLNLAPEEQVSQTRRKRGPAERPLTVASRQRK
ncbi:hypothetical protein R1sor_019175 [Riccia sorocarpa]|uniref:SWIM-type domain-containing protein n=1 Tax=Riccia sorocarpa TaxID=122646 RepID=A0ABD3IBS5_9MARC